MTSVVIHALELLRPLTPEDTVLEIEETNCKLMPKYLVRLTYISPRSKRSISITAKGDTLPNTHGSLLDFYIRQLILTPEELRMEFNRIYFMEKRARQEQFLFGGGKQRGNQVRVMPIESHADKIEYEERVT